MTQIDLVQRPYTEPGLAPRVATQQEAAQQEQFLPPSFPKQTDRQGGTSGVCPRGLLLSGLRTTKGTLLLGCFRLKEDWRGAWDDKTQGSGACHQQTWVWLPYLNQQEEPWAVRGQRRGSAQRKAGSGDNGVTVGGLSSQEMFPWHPRRSMVTLCGRLWVQPLTVGER